MILIPVIVGGLYVSLSSRPWAIKNALTFSYISAWTFVLAAITDFFDGYLARKNKIITVFGSFLDPIADKFLVVSALVVLQGIGRIPILVVLVLILREFYVTSLRLLAQDQGLSVPVDKWGKWKTATQMVAVPFLMVEDSFGPLSFQLTGTIFIYISALLSLLSAAQYTTGLWHKFKILKKEKKMKKKKEGNK